MPSPSGGGRLFAFQDYSSPLNAPQQRFHSLRPVFFFVIERLRLVASKVVRAGSTSP
jgi:hypothetical protein